MALKATVCRLFALFALFVFVPCRVTAQLEEVQFDDLFSEVRDAFPPDVKANWTLAFATDALKGLCPEKIRHWGWTRRNHVVRIRHVHISHDGVMCTDPDQYGSYRRFRFFRGSEVNAAFDGVGDVRMPSDLLELIDQTGPNIDARYAANLLGEEYFVGYEARDRICNDTVFFNAGTTAFLLRPFLRDVKVKRIDVPLTTGKKWLIMIPKYKGGSCLYESEIPPMNPEEGEDDDDPLPTPSIEAEESEEEDNVNESGSTSDEPVVANDQEIANNDANPGNDLDVVQQPNPSECFPSEAWTTLADGSVVRVTSLAVGDKVQVGPGQFSEIFMFTHKVDHVMARFRRFATESGHVLTVTPGHFVYGNGRLVRAAEVDEGDWVSLGDGQLSRVVNVSQVYLRGLHNPQTLHGDIVVNGVVASTYTEAVQPVIAHGLLSPLRLVYRMLSSDPSGGIFEYGSRGALRVMEWGVSSLRQ